MTRGEPFSGTFPGTAEEHVIRTMSWPTKLLLVLIFGWAACGPAAALSVCTSGGGLRGGRALAALAPLSGEPGAQSGGGLAGHSISLAAVQMSGAVPRCLPAPCRVRERLVRPLGLTARRAGPVDDPLDAAETVRAPRPSVTDDRSVRLPARLRLRGRHAKNVTQAAWVVKSAFLRLRAEPDEWPRFVPRPAWTQWRSVRARA